MSSFYDEIEIEDMDYNKEEDIYTYPCPCGDKFIISTDELIDGVDVAQCPSCSLIIKVIYDPDDFIDENDEETSFEVNSVPITV
ncbi:MAG: DPH3-like protein (CSL-type zinc finger-containing protein 2) [Benjaminiella poitrasii]|nr:MAG: DPH3-like protein (CSL-type zinc finger-containing protein 2) [Benjaminiella poitrasii]